MADLDAGATGTMTSAMMPDLIKPVHGRFAAGDRDGAAEADARVLPPINHENRQCGFRSAKAAMVEGGVISVRGLPPPDPAAASADPGHIAAPDPSVGPGGPDVGKIGMAVAGAKLIRRSAEIGAGVVVLHHAPYAWANFDRHSDNHAESK